DAGGYDAGGYGGDAGGFDGGGGLGGGGGGLNPGGGTPDSSDDSMGALVQDLPPGRGAVGALGTAPGRGATGRGDRHRSDRRGGEARSRPVDSDGGWGAVLDGVDGAASERAAAAAPRNDDWSVLDALVDQLSGGDATGDLFARLVAQVGAFVPHELRVAA